MNLTNDEVRELNSKLIKVRTHLLETMPFFERLLMGLTFGLSSCGTACTDMKHILWDPEFLKRLPDDETAFVMLHEVLHCSLSHIARSKGKNMAIYNIAADIVVNSIIMRAWNVFEMTVDGVDVMHLTPNDREGYLYTSDEVYEMLLKKYSESLNDDDASASESESVPGNTLDSHDNWETLTVTAEERDSWEHKLKECGSEKYTRNSMPSFLREILNRESNNVIDWKQVLNDFVQIVAQSYDYTFNPTDRRFSSSDFLLPSFAEMPEEKIENIWVVVDASGSVNTVQLSTFMNEVKNAIRQFSAFKAWLSFFDTKVSDPVEFENEQDLDRIECYGGGGTDFRCIFKYMNENMADNLPRAVIIMTDGYGYYPAKEAALEVPVLWIINENDEDAPWGKSVHVRL